jgi:hypothetical protein
VLEEVVLAQPDQQRLAWQRTALHRGDTSEQGTALPGNCEYGCEREESRKGFSGSSSVVVWCGVEARASHGVAMTAASGGRSVVRAVWRGGAVTGMPCRTRATGNRVRTVKRLLRLTSGPGFIL